MKWKSRKGYRAAFTLLELTIVLALFAVVAAMVTSFVIFMVRFNDRSDRAYDRTEQLTALRKEIDAWFSYCDSLKIELERSTSDTSDTLIFANLLEYSCSVSYSAGGKVTFVYPQNAFFENSKSGTVVLDCSYVTGISFDKISGDEESSENPSPASDADALYFFIRMPVTGQTYRCEIAYE